MYWVAFLSNINPIKFHHDSTGHPNVKGQNLTGTNLYYASAYVWNNSVQITLASHSKSSECPLKISPPPYVGTIHFSSRIPPRYYPKVSTWTLFFTPCSHSSAIISIGPVDWLISAGWSLCFPNISVSMFPLIIASMRTIRKILTGSSFLAVPSASLLKFRGYFFHICFPWLLTVLVLRNSAKERIQQANLCQWPQHKLDIFWETKTYFRFPWYDSINILQWNKT